MADEEIRARLRVGAEQFSAEVGKAKAQAQQVERQVDTLKARIDQQRARTLRVASEQRRMDFFRGLGPQPGRGFTLGAFRRMTEGARGAVFTIGASMVFQQLIGGSSPLQSALSQGLTGLTTGGLAGGAFGLISGTVTGLIGEVQSLERKVDAHERSIKGMAESIHKQNDVMRQRFIEEKLERRKQIEKIKTEIREEMQNRREAGYRLIAQGLQ